ncbi:hypothetical protein ACJMK2_004883 [Sinanodonta woodiana]|uniref:V-type proton ATPase subunit n=1 Tax=Sinanodonta woodiana TaxID=1069815 RepID=A0ABD3VQZ0_SINWO
MEPGSRGSITIAVITIFWGAVGIFGPLLVQFFMRGSQNKGIVQIMLIMTSVCCYLFWLCGFLFQLNPLLGPQLKSEFIRFIQHEW